MLQYLLAALFLRFVLIVYGEWQDRTMAVKYTDVDYWVFTDAANFMLKGKSPYERATYRYTPLLAWMLQPCILWTPVFGKLIFCILDTLTGFLIYKILTLKNISETKSKYCAFLWLFNPLPMAISSRGNAEALIAFLVLFSLYLLLQKQFCLSGCMYALAVHMKIYPVTYALAIYFHLNGQYKQPIRTLLSWKQLFLPNKNRIAFIASAVITISTLTIGFYWRYGWDFLHESYLYHVTRRDTRHNFSVYFYMLYLLGDSDYSTYVGLVVFLPQLLLMISVSWIFHPHPSLAWFLNTFIMVTYNKVCTSQYFMWYLSLLPLIVPYLMMSYRRAVTLVILWFIGQGLWLLPAYYLEFEGQNTFLYIWLAGLLFFSINIYLMISIVKPFQGHMSYETTKKQ